MEAPSGFMLRQSLGTPWSLSACRQPLINGEIISKLFGRWRSGNARKIGFFLCPTSTMESENKLTSTARIGVQLMRCANQLAYLLTYNVDQLIQLTGLVDAKVS